MHFNKLVYGVVFCLYLCGCNGSKKSEKDDPIEIVYGTEQQFEPPELSGEFQVGSKQYHWVDESRGEPHTADSEDRRELLVRIYYPTDDVEGHSQLPVYDFRRWPFWENAAESLPNHKLRKSNYVNAKWPVYIESPISSALGFYPLVIFSHGYGLSPEEHMVLAEDLASRGFIVASINHPYGSSRAIYPDGRIVYSEDLPRDNLGRDLDLWSDDQVFVINQMEQLNTSIDSLVYSKIDMSKVGVTGHSYGGAAAYYSAWKDDRVRAAVDIDGTIFNSEGKDIAVPFMLLQSGPGDSYEIFDQVANDGYGVAFKNNIQHLSFADYVLFWHWDFPNENPHGPLDEQVGLISTVDILEQFFNKYFEGSDAPLLDEPESKLDFTSVTVFD
ncbi:MAG: hypothetical protein KUG78_09405 [Kangiellaceae bacterium]|nr:hypothetical protein [Kangiellaceae bacterium]